MKSLNFNSRNIIITALAGALLLIPFIVGAQSDAKPSGEAEQIQELSGIQKVLWYLVSNLFGAFLAIGGWMLNMGVTDYVVGFGNQFTNFGFGFAVNNLWVVMRDFFNLFFIFGLVYIGFQMILNSGDINARRLLVHIILAALLVNFSLFFTKAIIDLSNIAATQIAGAFPDGTVAGQIGISDAFVNVLGLQGALDAGDATNLNAINSGGGYAYIFGTMILLIIATFVFAAGGILLFIRFVVLNLYMILSPVMFLGWVFPGLASYTTLYWKGFLGRAFFAPAYLLIVYFAYVVLDEFGALLVSRDYAALFTDSSSAIAAAGSTIPFFAFTAIFLIAAIVVGQKMGADGAQLAVSLASSGGRKVRNGVTRVTVGTANIPVRGVRNLTNRLGKSAEGGVNRLQAQKNIFGKMARTTLADTALRSPAVAMKDTKLGTGTNNEMIDKHKREINARANKTTGTLKNKAAYDEANKTLKDPKAKAEDLKVALTKLNTTIKDMTLEDKEKLGYDTLTNKQVALSLTGDDIEKLEKGGNYNSQQIIDIKNARNKAFAEVAEKGHTLDTATYVNIKPEELTIDQRAELVNRSAKEIGKMPVAVFAEKNMQARITPAMVEEKMKNGNMTDDELADIKKNVQSYLDKADTPSNKREMWKKWANKDTYGLQLGLDIREPNSIKEEKPEAPSTVNVATNQTPSNNPNPQNPPPAPNNPNTTT